MPPLDDELRAALHGRAATLAPAADPLAGIERRARGIRRRRVGASVAGSALAVLAVAGVVPALTPDRTSAPAPGDVATSAPSPAADALALDLRDPWQYRGVPLPDTELRTLQSEWAARHPGSTPVPLFGQVWEPSGQYELVLLDDTGDRWAYASGSESGWEFAEQPLPPAPVRALVAAPPGDEGTRVVVVAAPQVEELRYVADRRGADPTGPELAALADGVGTGPLETTTPDEDGVQAFAGGELVFTVDVPGAPAPAPAPTRPAEDEGPGTGTGTPSDGSAFALDVDAPWAYRGPAELTQHPDLAVQATRLFTEGNGADWSEQPLYAVELEDGLSVLLHLHRRGEQAQVSTTWQRGDEPARQAVLPVQDGALVLQAFVPETAGGVLLALASPELGAVETDVRGATRLAGEEGAGAWRLPADPAPGQVLLYAPGDGLLVHREAARRS